jgi:hypothetical protein
MARKQESRRSGLARLRDAGNALKSLFGRARGAEKRDDSARSATARPSSPRTTKEPQAGRVTRRETDIPLDVLDRAYTPHTTSSKASFRSDGSDHHSDQEFALGVADERWNDEDRLTNKSGDPRIGTHRRTYEPAEAGAESRE